MTQPWQGYVLLLHYGRMDRQQGLEPRSSGPKPEVTTIERLANKLGCLSVTRTPMTIFRGSRPTIERIGNKTSAVEGLSSRWLAASQVITLDSAVDCYIEFSCQHYTDPLGVVILNHSEIQRPKSSMKL